MGSPCSKQEKSHQDKGGGKEGDPLKPKSMYNAGKMAAEQFNHQLHNKALTSCKTQTQREYCSLSFVATSMRLTLPHFGPITEKSDDDLRHCIKTLKTQIAKKNADKREKTQKNRASWRSQIVSRNTTKKQPRVRAYRRPARSHTANVAKNSDTGDPDLGDPPGPSHLLVIPFCNIQSNSLTLPWLMSGCWCMERWRTV